MAFSVHRNAQLMSEPAEQHLQNGERIRHGAAAARQTPEFGDAISHLGIQPGGADIDSQPQRGGKQIDAHGNGLKLFGHIQERPAALLAKIAHIIIAAAAGNAPHSNLRVPRSALNQLVQGPVAAAGIEGGRLAVPRKLFGQCPRVAGIPGYHNFRFRQVEGRRGLTDLGNQQVTGIPFACNGIDEKDLFHPRHLQRLEKYTLYFIHFDRK